MNAAIADAEFDLLQRLLHRLTGIHLSPGKKLLLVERLSKRLAHYGLSSYSQYYRPLASDTHCDALQRFGNQLR